MPKGSIVLTFVNDDTDEDENYISLICKFMTSVESEHKNYVEYTCCELFEILKNREFLESAKYLKIKDVTFDILKLVIVIYDEIAVLHIDLLNS